MKGLIKHKRLHIANGKHILVEEHNLLNNHPLHWHSYFELEIILSGSGKYIVNDVSYDLSEYNMYLLTTTDFHHIEVSTPITLLNISFDEESVCEKDLMFLIFSQTEKAYMLSREEYERIVKAVELLQNEVKIDGDCQKQILQYILHCFFRKNNINEKNSLHNEHYERIKKSIIFMEMHFKEKITMEMLAKEAGYHPTYFSELFKKITGETYIKTLNKRRIAYARTLLANGFSVADACFLSGFSSLSNFGTIFKQNCKMSPYEYAKISRK